MKEIVDLPRLNGALAKLGTPTSLLVKGGGMLYSCGIPPLNPDSGEIVQGSIEEQTDAILSLMRDALEGAGSSLDKVVNITIFLADNALFSRVNSVYVNYFTNNFPARSFIAVQAWPLAFDIEISCIAVA